MSFNFLTLNFRRVHITKSTLLQLGDRFEVEPGDGMDRESYLADHKIESYLIIPPKVSNLIENAELNLYLFIKIVSKGIKEREG